jgi:8-oxo-dGTP pyrophosphatase MutT (NUDIX family)
VQAGFRAGRRAVQTAVMIAEFAAALIADQHGRYLMQLRDDKPGILHPGAWGLFGGGIEPGESAVAAVERELEEEIGLVPSPPQFFRQLRIPTRIDPGPVRIRRVAVFACTIEAARVGTLAQSEGAGRALWPPELLLLEPRVAISARLAVALHAEARLGQCHAPTEHFTA